jgi:hypothetical protein
VSSTFDSMGKFITEEISGSSTILYFTHASKISCFVPVIVNTLPHVTLFCMRSSSSQTSSTVGGGAAAAIGVIDSTIIVSVCASCVRRVTSHS